MTQQQTAKAGFRTVKQLPAAKKKPTFTELRAKLPYSIDTSSMKAGLTEIKGPNTVAPRKAPKVWYTPEVQRQMDFIVDHCDLEVGWMALVKYYEDDNCFLIYKVAIPEQTVHSVETDIDADAMAALGLELLDAGFDTSEMYAWFHSHVDMNVTPSMQDEMQVEEFLDTCPVFIRGILNKKGESKVDVYFREEGVAFTCVDTEVHYQFDNDPTEGLAELLNERLKDDPYSYQFDDYYQPFDPKQKTAKGPVQQQQQWANDWWMDESYTGYGEEWDERDHIADRPANWEEDPMYQAYGAPMDHWAN